MGDFQEIARTLSGIDNDSYMYPQRDFSHKCAKCNTPLLRDINPSFKLGKKIADVMHTYDGYTIVSNKFKEFCLRKDFNNLSFVELPNDTGFYIFTSNNILELDEVRRKVKFDEYCDLCQRFASIAGGTPAFLKDAFKDMENTIYRSDINFGYVYEQHPILIINLEVYKMIKKEKFKGVYFGKNDVVYI